MELLLTLALFGAVPFGIAAASAQKRKHIDSRWKEMGSHRSHQKPLAGTSACLECGDLMLRGFIVDRDGSGRIQSRIAGSKMREVRVRQAGRVQL